MRPKFGKNDYETVEGLGLSCYTTIVEEGASAAVHRIEDLTPKWLPLLDAFAEFLVPVLDERESKGEDFRSILPLSDAVFLWMGSPSWIPGKTVEEALTSGGPFSEVLEETAVQIQAWHIEHPQQRNKVLERIADRHAKRPPLLEERTGIDRLSAAFVLGLRTLAKNLARDPRLSEGKRTRIWSCYVQEMASFAGGTGEWWSTICPLAAFGNEYFLLDGSLENCPRSIGWPVIYIRVSSDFVPLLRGLPMTNYLSPEMQRYLAGSQTRFPGDPPAVRAVLKRSALLDMYDATMKRLTGEPGVRKMSGPDITNTSMQLAEWIRDLERLGYLDEPEIGYNRVTPRLFPLVRESGWKPNLSMPHIQLLMEILGRPEWQKRPETPRSRTLGAHLLADRYAKLCLKELENVEDEDGRTPIWHLISNTQGKTEYVIPEGHLYDGGMDGNMTAFAGHRGGNYRSIAAYQECETFVRRYGTEMFTREVLEKTALTYSGKPSLPFRAKKTYPQPCRNVDVLVEAMTKGDFFRFEVLKTLVTRVDLWDLATANHGTPLHKIILSRIAPGQVLHPDRPLKKFGPTTRFLLEAFTETAIRNSHVEALRNLVRILGPKPEFAYLATKCQNTLAVGIRTMQPISEDEPIL